MTNKQVVRAFLNCESGDTENVHSTGEKLFSYDTIIAQWIDGEIWVNATKYSRTTSKQMTTIINGNYKQFRDKNIPEGTKNLMPWFEKETV